MATKQQILDLIKAKIEGQGSNVDAGSALPTILNGIIDIIPEIESGGITFGGLVNEGDNIPTTPNRFYLTADYGSFTFGDDEEPFEIDNPGYISAIIVDSEGNFSIQDSQCWGVDEIQEGDNRPASSDAVYNALGNIRQLDVIDLTACELQATGDTLHNDPNVPADIGGGHCKPILVNSSDGIVLAYPVTPTQEVISNLFGDDDTVLLSGGVWATSQSFDSNGLSGGEFYSAGTLGGGQGRALVFYEY